MIDKQSEDWQRVPMWVSFGLLGFTERKQAILTIIMLNVCGIGFYLLGGWGEPLGASAIVWFSLYLLSTGWFTATVHWVDKKSMW